MGITSGNINKSKLTEDLGYLIERYVAVKDLSNINMGVLMEELMSLLTKYEIKMPSEFTLLVRSLVTFEGVIGELCPELDLFDLLTHKMVERMKESFDLRSKLTSLLRDVAATGADAMQMPGAVICLLRKLSKGRMKIGFELTGYDELMQKMQLTVRNIAFALFACVIFAGSCILCTTDIQPQAYGIPFIAMIGFVTSVALGIYTIIKMSSKK
jgi:ubiquinone biosynthesis protein